MKLFIEKHPKGYVVKEAKTKMPLATAQTQKRAIQIARSMNPDGGLDVERVRKTKRGKPNKWRKP